LEKKINFIRETIFIKNNKKKIIKNNKKKIIKKIKKLIIFKEVKKWILLNNNK
jgi:hypothetical protein